MRSGTSLLPEPRSYIGTATMFGGLSGLPFGFLYSFMMSLMMNRPFGEILPLGIVTGMFGGFFFGLAMAFFFRGETLELPAPDKQLFVARLNVATSQLGYFPASVGEDFFTYKPSFQAGLAAGRISVQLVDGRTILVGPSWYVRKLVRRINTAGVPASVDEV